MEVGLRSIGGATYFDPRSVFHAELMRDERVLWAGQPDPKRRFSQGDMLLIPFSILWGGFALFWEGALLNQWLSEPDNRPLLSFVLWGIPFVLMGFYLMFGRFIYRARKKKRTYYALTDQRVMVLERLWRGDRVLASSIETIPSIDNRIRKDGSGSILFGVPSKWTEDWATSRGFDFTTTNANSDGAPLGFYDIPDARTVAQLLDGLRRRRPT